MSDVSFYSKVRDWFIDAFPTPKYLLMQATVLDMSPNSVKCLNGKFVAKGCLPVGFKEVFLPEGTIVDGIVANMDALISALRELREHSGKKFAFVSIPENAVYLYTLQLNGRPNKVAIQQQIEFSFSEHVPMNLEDALYDFDIVGISRNGVIVSITVAPKELIEKYYEALTAAGFSVRAIELEAYSVTRAVSEHAGVEMIVDVGYERAGIIIAKNGIPVFSITVPGGSKTPDVVIDEAKKQYAFWDTRTNSKGKRVERITKVIVTGGSGDELIEALSKSLEGEVTLANVWRNLFDIDKYIPDIDAQDAQGMATLSGLLLKNKD